MDSRVSGDVDDCRETSESRRDATNASPEEADRVLAALSNLIDATTSDLIRAILEDACFLIADLVPSQDDPDEEDAMAA